MLPIERILAAASRHQRVAETLLEALASDLAVPHPYYRLVAQFIAGFLREHGTLPKDGDYGVWAGTLPDQQRPAVLTAIGAIQRENIDSYTPDFLAEAALEELRNQAAKTALARLNSIPDVTPEVLKAVGEEVDKIRSVTLEGAGSIRDVHLWLEERRDSTRIIPTGIHGLDRFIEGWKEELVFIMADSGVGKTTALVNHGVAAARYGFKVLHISMENQLSKVLHRYYRRIGEATRADFRRDLPMVAGRVQHWLKFAKGEVLVLYLDSYSVDVEQVRLLCDRFATRVGGLDMLILDYIDLLSPTSDMRNRSEYQHLSVASHRLRSVCPAFNASVLSATQSVRGAGNRRRQRLSDMGDSYGKVRAADVVLGLSQTEEEEAEMQGRYTGLKLRESSGKGMEIPLYINMDLMYIADLDHPNTRRLIAQHPRKTRESGSPAQSAPLEGT